jgi:hypothetical protein
LPEQNAGSRVKNQILSIYIRPWQKYLHIDRIKPQIA